MKHLSIILSTLSVCIFSACSSSGPYTKSVYTYEQEWNYKGEWTYEKAKKVHAEYEDGMYFDKLSQNKSWADPATNCDPDSSFLPFVPTHSNMEIVVTDIYEIYRKGESGDVRASFVIDENGRTDDITFLKSGTDEMNERVSDAIQNTRYVPGYCNGVAIKANSIFQISFMSAEQ